MNPRIAIKGSLAFFLLLFILLSAGTIKGSGIGNNPLHLLHKGEGLASSRKLLGFDAVLDYDYAGPNPKHDPKGKKGGGGSKNP